MYQVSVTRIDRCDVASSRSVTPRTNFASLSQNFLQFFVHVTVEKRDAEGGHDPEQRLQDDGEEGPGERHSDGRRLIGPTIGLR